MKITWTGLAAGAGLLLAAPAISQTTPPGEPVPQPQPGEPTAPSPQYPPSEQPKPDDKPRTDETQTPQPEAPDPKG